MTLAERFFPDGYCACRCGPVHHRLFRDSMRPLVLICTYHRRDCGVIEDVEGLMGLGGKHAFDQLEPLLGRDRAMEVVRDLLQARGRR